MVESELRSIFNSGVTLPLESRKQMLLRLKEVIVRREDEIFAALRRDLGKCQFEAKISETGFIISEINHHLKHLDDWAKEVIGVPPVLAQPAKTRLIPCPKGTVLVISPWNYPFQLSFGPLIGAVAAGNCVALKPSELTQETGVLIAGIINEVFNNGAVQCLLGGAEVAENLLEQPFDHFFFTGSKRVGKIVAHAAAEQFASSTLEMGGKSPCIVDDTASTIHSARRIAWGKALNAGQTCVAPDYLLAHESIQRPLIDSIMSEWKSFYGDDPERSADYSRIINVDHFDRLDAMLENTKGKILGGRRNRASRFFEPTIVANVD